jgi:hypothetical protein
MNDSEDRLAKLPPHVRNELNAKPISTLIDEIEGYQFESEAGPLENCLDWIELKARLHRLIPKPH